MCSQFVIVLQTKIKRAFPLFGQREISVHSELTLGELRYHLTHVPPSQTPHLTKSSAPSLPLSLSRSLSLLLTTV